MIRIISGFLLIISAGLIIWTQTPVSFYLQPKQERLAQLWAKDIQNLSLDKNFTKVFSQLGGMEVFFTDPEIATEFDNFQLPFTTRKGLPLTLKVSVTRWIEVKTYGFVIQHEIFDSQGDKVYEFGRTYQVGYIL